MIKVKYLNQKETSKDNANGEINLSSDTDDEGDDIPHKTTFGLSNSLYNKPWIKSNWENHY